MLIKSRAVEWFHLPTVGVLAALVLLVTKMFSRIPKPLTPAMRQKSGRDGEPADACGKDRFDWWSAWNVHPRRTCDRPTIAENVGSSHGSALVGTFHRLRGRNWPRCHMGHGSGANGGCHAGRRCARPWSVFLAWPRSEHLSSTHERAQLRILRGRSLSRGADRSWLHSGRPKRRGDCDVKHFAAKNSEHDRHRENSIIEERALGEISSRHLRQL